MERRLAVVALVVLTTTTTASNAAADGLDLDTVGSRSIGRAGATMVSEDGGAALLLNPAGLVRRTQLRVQVGMAFHDDDTSFRASNSLGSPDIENRAPVLATPSIAIVGALGPFVVGAAYLERGDLQRTLPTPRFDQPAAQVSQFFPHRYAGTALRFQHHSFSVGVALRTNSWLGIGLSISVDQINLAETRYIWAGFAGRDGLANPTRDLELGLDGTDRFVPGAQLGVLIAPPHLPMELALSASYSADATFDASAVLLSRRSSEFPAPEQLAPKAATQLSLPLRLRAGLRYLGERLFLEANAEVGMFVGDHASPTWKLQGIFVRDQTTTIAELATVPSLIDRRSYAGAAISADLELVDGFVWLTSGYGYRSSASRHAKATAAFADFGGHTVAVGAEGQWNGMTLSVGYARFIQGPRTVTNSVVALPNPFDGGTTAIGNGRYTRARDSFGAQLEVSWD